MFLVLDRKHIAYIQDHIILSLIVNNNNNTK